MKFNKDVLSMGNLRGGDRLKAYHNTKILQDTAMKISSKRLHFVSSFM